jgi:hypothetical protein
MDQWNSTAKYIQVNRVSDPDPDWIRIQSGQRIPNPYSESGSGSRREKMTHKVEKNLKISCFEVLDVLF